MTVELGDLPAMEVDYEEPMELGDLPPMEVEVFEDTVHSMAPFLLFGGLFTYFNLRKRLR